MSGPGAAESFWAERLGCSPRAFEAGAFSVLAHAQPDRVYALATAFAVVVAAPEALHARLRAAPDPRALVSPAGLRALVPADARLVGPARLAYLHRTVSFPEGVVAIPSSADPRLAALRAAVRADEWEHANLGAAEPPIFAVLRGGAIAAAAGSELLLGRVAHVGVLAHPRERGRGLARRAVQAAAAAALERGLLPQYQTLASNAPALAIAAALGFEPFAATLAARL